MYEGMPLEFSATNLAAITSSYTESPALAANSLIAENDL
jgi:hypothetical protein